PSGHRTGALLPAQRLRTVRGGRERLGVVQRPVDHRSGGLAHRGRAGDARRLLPVPRLVLQPLPGGRPLLHRRRGCEREQGIPPGDRRLTTAQRPPNARLAPTRRPVPPISHADGRDRGNGWACPVAGPWSARPWVAPALDHPAPGPPRPWSAPVGP